MIVYLFDPHDDYRSDALPQAWSVIFCAATNLGADAPYCTLDLFLGPSPHDLDCHPNGDNCDR